MVTAHHVGEDKTVPKIGSQAVGQHKVVDAPAHILLSGVVYIAPPGIKHSIGIQRAEGIDKAAGKKL